MPALSSQFETSGYVLNAQDVDKLMELNDIYYLSEVMDFKGVINKDTDIINKINSALTRNKVVDGHAPGLCFDDAHTNDILHGHINSIVQ
ncbi:hypothetical protein KJD10_04275 [Borreliella valaisiana]|uniref:hypothetical protein n=1 Tax=Borreliella valaisiana TaxID=62088 RepID=UPI0027380867|nr:hypothetical protein [Borreliella valaisiana]WLN25614.1 hypothetical protein KJD10_04275 [Borreliella valaisiana]